MTDEERQDNMKETLLAYKRVFNSKDGKIVLADLIKCCHFLVTSAVDRDPHMTYFYEGERNVVVRILNTLEKEPDYISNLFNINSGGKLNVQATYTDGAS